MIIGAILVATSGKPVDVAIGLVIACGAYLVVIAAYRAGIKEAERQEFPTGKVGASV